MAKNRLIPILITSLLLLLTSCGLDYRYSLDKSVHNNIEYVWAKDKNLSYIIYNDDRYMYIGSTGFFHVDTYEVADKHYELFEDDILLSWNGYRYIWYIDEYYSYTLEDPIFIYNERLGDVYFHEDYNYLMDTFVIKDTTSEIVWENMFYSEQPYFDFANPICVIIYSKQCPRINTYLKLVCVENQWYLSLSDHKTVWLASDEFIKILLENGIVGP